MLVHGRRKYPMTVAFTEQEVVEKFTYWGNKCWMCGRKDLPLHKDHVKPISKGGWHVLSNIRPACQPCNSSKGNKWPYKP